MIVLAIKLTTMIAEMITIITIIMTAVITIITIIMTAVITIITMTAAMTTITIMIMVTRHMTQELMTEEAVDMMVVEAVASTLEILQ